MVQFPSGIAVVTSQLADLTSETHKASLLQRRIAAILCHTIPGANVSLRKLSVGILNAIWLRQG